ncbi:DNA polymerase IV [Knoellia sinensis KCTC 19936]|uniref:DNA polymerase IV n=1 Tax=Knoellia sinensis KCTC 19936 TaxID=1385520 RepID=A0A0A0JBD5_9MICO|nr:DNA polymerase IV [Knoellia sinensis]KGN34099.1 DNA polymerase IV [Knoellia sinensis KCTC 19936]
MLIHADADAFFASVEQRDFPHLRGRPMVVGPQVVACASYEARALGVHAGMPLRQALRRWPDLVVAEFRGDVYESVSADLMALFRDVTPLVEPGSMEEAFLDVSALDGGSVEEAGRIAADLRARARRDLGLPVSAGVARAKLFAKLASRRAKPDGLFVVDAETEARVRPRLPVSDLWGVGPASTTKLHDAGVRYVADLAGWTVDTLVDRRITKAMARNLIAIRDGVDDATIKLPGPRKSISSTRSLGRATRQRSVVENALRDNVIRAMDRLGDDPRAPTRIDVHLRYDDQHAIIQPGSLDQPTRDVTTLVGAALAALERTAYEEDGRGVAMVGVAFALPAPPA